MAMRRENVAAALKYLQDKADLRGRLQRATSLDPQEQDLADIAVETGASFIPGVGPAIAARDVERARRADDPAGMAMAAAGAIPGGKLAGLLKRYDPTRLELDVYHGTPHRFPATEANPLGEFDASKIGSGEGAQAYGHGLYFAENPKVAGSYREARWQDEELIKKLKTPSLTKDEYTTLGELTRKSRSGVEKLSEAEEKTLAKLERQQIKQAKELFAARKAAGTIYKADLPDEMIGQMLDYDKPLSKQPKAIQEAVKQFDDFEPSDSGKFVMESIASGLRIKGGSPTGRKLEFPYSTPESIAQERAYPAQIAEKLRTAGIPGIVYRDAGSRGKSSTGTRNFVVFPGEEKKVRILERK